MAQRYDDQFTARNTVDRETLRGYIDACDPSQIARDHLGRPTSLPTVSGESSGGMRVVEARPLEPVPGLAIMDQMMSVEDKLWRRELKARLGVREPTDDGPKAT